MHLVDSGQPAFGRDAPGLPTGYAEPGPGAGQITLHWTPATTGRAATRWGILWRKSLGGSFLADYNVAADSRTYTIGNLELGVAYDIRILGFRGPGVGLTAQASNVTPLDLPLTLDSASVDGATVTLVFSVLIDEDSVPPKGSFQVSLGDVAQTPTGVAVDGKTVTLTLATAAAPGQAGLLSYTKPRAKPLRDTTQRELDGFANRAVANATGGLATADAGDDLEVRPGFSVTLSGSGSSTRTSPTLTYAWKQTAGAPVTLKGATTTAPSFTAPSFRTDLVFSLTVNDGVADSAPDAVTVRVRPPPNPSSAVCAHPAPAGTSYWGGSLLDAVSSDESSISFTGTGLPAARNSFWFCRPNGTRDTLAQDVSGGSAGSVTGLAKGTTYWLAVKLRTIHGDVRWQDWQAVTTAGSTTAHAGDDREVLTGASFTLSGSGTTRRSNPTWTYRWTQTGGETVTLDDATSATPSFTAPPVRTDLVFSLVVNDGAHESAPDTVTVRVRPPPNPASAPCAHPGTPTAGHADFVVVTERTGSSIKFRGTAGGGGQTNDLWFCRPDGTRERLAAGVSRDHIETVSGLTSGTTYWAAVRLAESELVLWSPWVAVATTDVTSIQRVRLTSAPAVGDTYLRGETIRAAVSWSEPVTVDAKGSNDNVALRLDLGADDANYGDSRRSMSYVSGSGTDTLTFEYTVQPGDFDGDGVWVQTESATAHHLVVLVNGATIRKGTVDAGNIRSGLPTTGDARHKVDGTAAAAVLGAAFTSSPASGDTYRLGGTIRAAVTWDKPVTVANAGANDNVSLRLDLGADDANRADSRRSMSYVSGSGTRTLTFAYTVAAGDRDADGVWLQTASATDATMVFLANGATLRYAATDVGRTLSGLPTSGDAGRMVDARSGVAAAAGDDREVLTGAAVTLSGSGTSTRTGATLTYAWTQTQGPTVPLRGATSATAVFTAPPVQSSTDLTFSLVVSDGTFESPPDTVTVTVLPSRVDSASVDGATLTVTFDTALKATSKPAGSAFTVTAVKAGSSRSIAGTAASVAIADRTVTATLSAAVVADERLTVRYDRPTSGAVLEDSAGAALPGFLDRPAANTSDSTGPAFVSAVANGDTVVFTFDEALDATSPLERRAFQRIVGAGSAWSLAQTHEVSGRTVTVTYRAVGAEPAAATHGQAVWARYQQPTTNRLKDLSGNEAPGVGRTAATNNTPPAYKSASVNGNALTITFDGELDGSAVPAASAFTVKATRSGTERDVALADTAPVAVSGATVTLTLAEAVLRVDAVTVAYAAPATGKLRDADNAKLPVTEFGAQTATNDTPADTTGPAFVSAVANGDTVVFTFDEALDATSPLERRAFQRIVGDGSTWSLAQTHAVAGRTVTVTYRAVGGQPTAATHGQAVWARYDEPATNRLKDLSGNEAPGVGRTAATNNTPPAYSSASVNGNKLTVTFDGALDAGSVPVPSAFTVKATRSGTERDVALAGTDPVALSDATVTLTLAEAVLPAAVDTAVTVAYAAGATGAKLQDADNAKLPVTGFGDTKAVTNAAPADTTGPAFSSASVNGAALTVTFDEALDQTKIPSHAAFRVRVDGPRRTFVIGPGNDLVVDGRTVTGTLASAVTHDQRVTVEHRPLSVAEYDHVRDLLGNQAPAFSAKTATNNTPPAFSSASVNGSVLTVTFDGGLDEDAVPAASAFEVKATRSGTEREVALADTAPVAVSGSTVELTLAEAVLRVDAVTVAYAAPGAGPKLQDADRAMLPVTGFGAQTADNDTPADTRGPRIASATANGDTMTITFDEALDESVIPRGGAFQRSVGGANPVLSTSVSLDKRTATATFATAVAHDDVVTMAFALDSDVSKRIRDPSGNHAPASGGFRSVTNNTPPGFSSASVNGSVLTVTFSGALDGSAVPAASAFEVKATRSGTERDVALADTDPVALSGSTVELTLAEAVLRVDAVTVAYTAPGTGAKLQDADRAMLPVTDFGAQTVTNDTPADTQGPRIASTTANGDTMTITFDEALDESVIPRGGAFQRSVGGANPVLSTSVSLDKRTATATFATAVDHDDVVTMAFALDSDVSKRIRDPSGNHAPASGGFRSVTNNTPPGFSSASVNGSVLTVTFDGGLDGSAVPAASAFEVKATRSGTERDVALADTGAVALSGSTVELTLAEAVLRVDAVTVAYTAPGTGAKLQDADRAMLPVADFGAQTADNDTPADGVAPSFASATTDGTTLTITFNEALDETQPPAEAKHTIRVAFGTASSVSSASVRVSGRTVIATLVSPPGREDEVEVFYRATTAVPTSWIRDLSGNRVGHFTKRPVTNNTPPAYKSASVNGNALTITFDDPLDGSAVPAASAFPVKATRAGTERDVALADTAPVAVSGATVTLTLAETLLRVDAVTVAYTAPATGAKLRDAGRAMVPVMDFAAQSADNATPADTTEPAFVSATANGNTVVFTFDEELDATSPLERRAFQRIVGDGSTWSLAQTHEVSGRTVTVTYRAVGTEPAAATHGQKVWARYDQPTTNRLKDLSGNEAPGVGRTAATNNTPPAYDSASVNGNKLTVTFDGALDAGSVPVQSAFTVKATRSGTERDVSLADTTPVVVSGSRVTLTLAEALLRVDTVTVAYAAPATGKLRDADNAMLPVTGFGDTKTATNDTPADTNAPAFSSASVNGAALTVTFDEALEEGSVPAAAAFTVTVGGTAVDLAATAPVAVDGSAVTLTLAAAVAAGQSVKVGYDPDEAGTGTLRDSVGNEAPGFTAKDADNRTPVPETRIASMAVVSAPSVDADNDDTAETYGRGEVIRVKVTWSADVLWDVSASGASMAVRLDVGGTARTAALVTGGAQDGQARELSFEYTVVRADTDADGVAVTRTAAHDVVLLSGGATLEDTHGRNASRTHAALSAGAGHKVDGARTPAADTAAPEVTAAAVDAATGRVVTLTFDKDLRALSGAQMDELRKWGLTVIGAYVEGVRIPGMAPERIAIAGRTLTLHLRSQYAAQEILPGREIAVGYRADLAESAGAPLRGANGEAVAAFTRTMTRAGAAEPLLSSAAVAGTKLTLTFDEELDPTSAPAGRRFHVWADDPYKSRRLIYGTGAARVSGRTVAVTLASAVEPYENAWLFYQKGDDPNPLRGASPSAGVSGPVARDVNGFLYATVNDRTAPKLVSAVAAGRTVALYYDEPLDAGSVPAVGDYEVFVGSTKQTVSNVAVSVSGVVLTHGTSAAETASVKVSYTAGSNPVMDPAGNRAANLSDHTVDNQGPTDDGNAPALESTGASHGVLTLDWNQPIDPRHVPAAGAFTLSQPDWWVTNGLILRSVTSVAVRGDDGDKVELGLSKWVFPCSESFTVSYDKSKAGTGNELRSVWGRQADGFTSQAVAIGAGGCWRAAVRASTEASEPTRISMAFDRPLDRRSAPSRDEFEVRSDGAGEAPAGPVAVADVGIGADPAGLRLTLDRALVEGERLTVRYRLPATSEGLRDTDGNQAAPFSVETVVGAGAPAATGVAVASDAGADATYAAGDTVRVAVTFDEAVAVDTEGGTPRLKLDLGGDEGAGERWAAYEDGSGTETLSFAWTAAAPDESPVGVAVLADTLELDGGTIRSAATQADAALGHSGTDPDPAHKVDAVAPAVAGASVAGTTLTLTFDEGLGAAASLANGAFAVKKTPAGGAEAAVGLSTTVAPAIGGRTVTLTLASAVVPGDTDVKVSYTAPASGTDNALRDVAGNVAADFADRAVANATAPAATGVAMASDPGSDDTYAAGDTVRVAVTFSEAVEVDTEGGTPRLRLDLGGDDGAGERWAAYAEGSGTQTLTFAWTAAAADESAAGVAVLADTLELDGGTIRSAATQADAALSHAGLDPDPAHKVDAVAPKLVRGEIDGGTVTLWFSEALDPGSTGAGSR